MNDASDELTENSYRYPIDEGDQHLGDPGIGGNGDHGIDVLTPRESRLRPLQYLIDDSSALLARGGHNSGNDGGVKVYLPTSAALPIIVGHRIISGWHSRCMSDCYPPQDRQTSAAS